MSGFEVVTEELSALPALFTEQGSDCQAQGKTVNQLAPPQCGNQSLNDAVTSAIVFAAARLGHLHLVYDKIATDLLVSISSYEEADATSMPTAAAGSQS